MKKINEPDFKVSDVCDTAITDSSNKEDKHIKDVFTQVDSSRWKAQLELYERIYLDNRDQLYTMEEMNDAYGITIKQMEGIYIYCMNSSHSYQDRLYSLTQDRCPICDKRWGFNDKNLDHVLPKLPVILLQLAVIVISKNIMDMLKINRQVFLMHIFMKFL